MSRRTDHSFIGVYELSSKNLRYLDPSLDRDQDPVWSPDGTRIACLRIPASRELQAFRPHREAAPWSIRVADASGGEGREIFKAAPRRGSVFRRVVAEDQLFWTSRDQIVFPWEGDGWTHLYTVSASGGAVAPVLLTPGEFEVEYVAMSLDRKRVVYNSNQDDIDCRHLWNLTVAKGKPEPLTKGIGIEWSPVVMGDGRSIAFLRADARRPPRPAVLTGEKEAQDLAPGSIPAEFPEKTLV